MKHFSLFCFLLSIGFIHAQSVVDFEKTWYIYDSKSFTPEYCTRILSFQGDTLIGLSHYLELFRSDTNFPDEQWESTGLFLREDSLKRVYIWEDGREALLYDFSLNEGDTIDLSISFYECPLRVVEVDTVHYLDGVARKRLKLVRSDDPDPESPWAGFKYWVEGVGSLTSLTDYIESCFTDYRFNLLCLYENGNKIYPVDLNSSCFLTTSVDNIVAYTLRMYPNPASSLINIESSLGFDQLSIYDLNGNRLIVSTEHSVDVSSLASGLYIVKIQYKGHETTQKLIVSR